MGDVAQPVGGEAIGLAAVGALQLGDVGPLDVAEPRHGGMNDDGQRHGPADADNRERRGRGIGVVGQCGPKAAQGSVEGHGSRAGEGPRTLDADPRRDIVEPIAGGERPRRGGCPLWSVEPASIDRSPSATRARNVDMRLGQHTG